MWERFSYFGMLALLIIYLNKDLKLPSAQAAGIFKWYTSLIYFTPLLGGYLADRWLGNKRAVVIGAILMAIGHFLMTFPNLPALYSALVTLVIGCGLLTPPLTSQVGLLYERHDLRRDSGYTLFYMGINLGAFASPLLCGWLVDNTRGRYHSGFALAGFGMALALVTYLVGLRWVVELNQHARAGDDSEENSGGIREANEPTDVKASIVGEESSLGRQAPQWLAIFGCLLGAGSPLVAVLSWVSWDTVLALELVALCAFVTSWITRSIGRLERERVLAILVLAVFVILFWGGSGQSGNAINLWAEQNTNRYLTQTPPEPGIFPEAGGSDQGTEETGLSQRWWEHWATMFRKLPAKEAAGPQTWSDWWASCWNPVPTAWFQSINPLLIFLLAPALALLWTWLGKRGIRPSIPMKMAFGLFFMTLAFALMAGGSLGESQPVTAAYRGQGLQVSLNVNALGQVCKSADNGNPQPYAAGRLYYDATAKQLRVLGVLSDLARDEIVGDTAPAHFVAKLAELQQRLEDMASSPAGWAVEMKLDREVPGLDLRYGGFGKIAGNNEFSYDAATRSLVCRRALEEKDIRGLKVAAGDPDLREALDELMKRSSVHRISPLWLLGFFFLATVGELCLSPIGLSMVSQLAPARFATLMMSVWLLTFSFGNFLAGAFGEYWGIWAPPAYFLIVTMVLAVGTLILFALVRRICGLMHGAE
jgi:POT family proton-dependent oligopeptide transporter